MKKQFYMITGLPRSGSTLMASILSQNPKIGTNIASPVNGLVEQLLHFRDDGFNKILNQTIIKKLIKNTFETVYEDVDKEIILDSNRCWSGKLSLLRDIFPYTKVICMVRDINEILNSFENIYQKNLYKSDSNLYGMDDTSVYSRSHSLMQYQGVAGLALNYLKQGLHSKDNDMLMLIEYNDLVNDTENVINDVYDFLGLERYLHDFNNLKNIPGSEIVDKELNLEGLHTIRKSVNHQETQWLIPYDLANQYNGLEYWKSLTTESDEPFDDSLPLDDQAESLDG